jgi:hypothetical protein
MIGKIIFVLSITLFPGLNWQAFATKTSTSSATSKVVSWALTNNGRVIHDRE